MRKIISFTGLFLLIASISYGAYIKVRPTMDNLPKDDNGNISCFATVEDGWLKVEDRMANDTDRFIKYVKGNKERCFIFRVDGKFLYMWEQDKR